jgi:hypothetical protein
VPAHNAITKSFSLKTKASYTSYASANGTDANAKRR